MKIGFFGCGNMGRAIAEGFRKSDVSLELFFYTPSQTKAQVLAATLKGTHLQQLDQTPKDLDWAILAFKPQQLKDFHHQFGAKTKILSVLAGVGIDTLTSRFKTDNISRLMPNTPSSIGVGANLLYAPKDEAYLQKLLSPLGEVFIMKDEEQLDGLTPFTGSGPALIFEFARIFESSLSKITTHKDSRKMIIQTFLGSSRLMEEALNQGISLTELREQVTSKKGVTYEALQTMEKHSLSSIMEEAFNAAYNRTLELKGESK